MGSSGEIQIVALWKWSRRDRNRFFTLKKDSPPEIEWFLGVKKLPLRGDSFLGPQNDLLQREECFLGVKICAPLRGGCFLRANISFSLEKSKILVPKMAHSWRRLIFYCKKGRSSGEMSVPRVRKTDLFTQCNL